MAIHVLKTISAKRMVGAKVCPYPDAKTPAPIQTQNSANRERHKHADSAVSKPVRIPVPGASAKTKGIAPTATPRSVAFVERKPAQTRPGVAVKMKGHAHPDK